MSTIGSEADIEAKVAAFRRGLAQELGVAEGERRHYKRPAEPATPISKANTTIIFCALPATLQEVLLGVLEGLGYKAERLPAPDQESLAIGKEFCNRGQCIPTYYTIGTLLKFLFERRREGLGRGDDPARALCALVHLHR